MRKVDELKLQISQHIRNSEEYKEYRRLQNEINRMPDLKRQVDEFRRQNFEMQNSPDIQDMYSAMAELNERFADMRKQDIVNRYLTAEIIFCSYIRDIHKAVAEAADIELDFL